MTAKELVDSIFDICKESGRSPEDVEVLLDVGDFCADLVSVETTGGNHFPLEIILK